MRRGRPVGPSRCGGGCPAGYRARRAPRTAAKMTALTTRYAQGVVAGSFGKASVLPPTHSRTSFMVRNVKITDVTLRVSRRRGEELAGGHVIEQPGMRWPPVEKFAGVLAGGGGVCSDQGADPAELVGRGVGRDGLDGQVESA